MKTLNLIFSLMIFSVGISSCTNEDQSSTNFKNTESKKLQSEVSKSTGINIIYQNKRYEQLEDKSVSYFDQENNYQGDLILRDYGMVIEDNGNSSGEIILTNPQTNKVITVYNLRTENNKNLFDLKCSNGFVYAGLENNEQSPTMAKGGIVGIIVVDGLKLHAI